MVVRFITFGAGEQTYIDAGCRLVNQAHTTGLFENPTMYTKEYLELQPDFWETHSEFIQRSPRGFGYWLWKPYIIQKTMSQMTDGDVLLYLDCGCEIDVKKTEAIREFINYVQTESAPIIGSFALRERDWNKQDLVERIGVNTPDDLESVQYQAGALLILVCEQTRKLVDEWYTIGCDYLCIDDSPSQSPNPPGFMEHRHDQSIFSLLAKKYRLYSNRRLCSVIEYIRNKTGVSRL